MSSNKRKRFNVDEAVTHYETMRRFAPAMYQEAVSQYRNMSNGGNGGTADGENRPIREAYYDGYEDAFFSDVLAGLGE